MFDVLVRRDIQQTLDHFRRTMDQVFGEFFGSSGFRATGSNGTQWSFVPAVETGWTDESLNLRFIVPGVSEGDLKVYVQGNQLIVEGERKSPQHLVASGAFTQLVYGKFYRAIDLPAGLDLEKIDCRLHDGVLDVRIPVAEAMKPRRIPIAAGEPAKAIEAAAA